MVNLPHMTDAEYQALKKVLLNNDAEAMQVLLCNGLDIRAVDSYERTPLHWAAYYGALRCARVLLDAGADLTAKDDNGDTPLALAQYTGNAASVCMLRLAQQDEPAPIMQAVWRGDTVALGSLLAANDAQPAMNAADAYGYTPLHVAVLPGSTACLPLLLSAGADANVLSCEGNSPLMLATQLSDISTMKALVAAGASLELTQNETPLLIAIGRNDIEAVSFLLSAGADVNKGDACNGRPLHHAALRPQIMQLLLAAGAEVDAVNGGGNTPLLVCAGADVKGVESSVRLLIDAGADVNHNCNKSGRTALFWAAGCRAVPGLIQMLLEAGADPNLNGCDGFSALHLAARFSNAEGVRLLLAAGADPAAQDNQGKYPHDEAMGRDHKECRELLLAALRERGIQVARKKCPPNSPGGIRRKLRRKAIVLRAEATEQGADAPLSRLGCVTRQLPGESCPTDAEENPLEPLATIFLRDLPHLPSSLKKLALITVFAPRDAWASGAEDARLGCVIRAYSTTENLEVCDYRATGLTPCILTPEPVSNDMPAWQACGGSDELWEQIGALEAAHDLDYRENICDTAHETHKIGGYPTYAQEAPQQPAGYSFVLQICSDDAAGLSIGDCGSYYFFYNPRRNDWRVHADCY